MKDYKNSPIETYGIKAYLKSVRLIMKRTKDDVINYNEKIED